LEEDNISAENVVFWTVVICGFMCKPFPYLEKNCKINTFTTPTPTVVRSLIIFDPLMIYTLDVI
jgi:hypothetical protein